MRLASAALALLASVALSQLPHEEVFERVFQLVPGRLLLALDAACLNGAAALAVVSGVLLAFVVDAWLGRR